MARKRVLIRCQPPAKGGVVRGRPRHGLGAVVLAVPGVAVVVAVVAARRVALMVVTPLFGRPRLLPSVTLGLGLRRLARRTPRQRPRLLEP